MSTKVVKMERVVTDNLPDGTYDGLWSGYKVSVSAHGQQWRLQTVSGVRGINIPVTVTISQGVGEVTTKTEAK